MLRMLNAADADHADADHADADAYAVYATDAADHADAEVTPGVTYVGAYHSPSDRHFFMGVISG